jgi:hypothetical protein
MYRAKMIGIMLFFFGWSVEILSKNIELLEQIKAIYSTGINLVERKKKAESKKNSSSCEHRVNNLHSQPYLPFEYAPHAFISFFLS